MIRCAALATQALLLAVKLARGFPSFETFFDLIRSKAFGRDGDEANGGVIRFDRRQADATQDQIERTLGLGLGRLIQHDIHNALAQGGARVFGQFVPDEQYIPAAPMTPKHIDQSGVRAARIIEADQVRIDFKCSGQGFGAVVFFVASEAEPIEGNGTRLVAKVVGEPPDAIAVYLIDRMA